VLNQLNYKDFR